MVEVWEWWVVLVSPFVLLISITLRKCLPDPQEDSHVYGGRDWTFAVFFAQAMLFVLQILSATGSFFILPASLLAYSEHQEAVDAFVSRPIVWGPGLVVVVVGLVLALWPYRVDSDEVS